MGRNEERKAVCARFEALYYAILATEASLGRSEPRIDEGLDPERLRALYERRFALELPPLPFRAPTVDALLRRARALLTPDRLLVLAAGEAVRHEDGRLEARLTTGEGESAHHWSLHAICDARFWGIDIRPIDPASREVVEESVWGRVLQSLESDLASLAKIERRFAHREGPPEMEIVSTGEGEAFERLMTEILDCPPWKARQASLAEDFLEKTDLRVSHPELGRPRGARVQVALTGSRARSESKREQIRAAEEFVHLSPRTLAEALVSGVLSGAETAAVHRALGTAKKSTGEIAWELRRHFLQAIREPREDPRGPIMRIPESVRGLVRAYVTQEATAATRALRENEARRSRNRTPPCDPTGDAQPADVAAPEGLDEVL
ncbi:MAG: hypothetical protein ACK47B_21505 [Armatimonadota bacterium]